MAKAGYCSECGRNVYVTPEGACELGHGPECVSDVYEVPEPEAAAESAPSQEPTASASSHERTTRQPVYPAAPVLPIAPQRNRTGLVVVVVSIVLLLCACVLAGPILFRAISKTTGTKQTTSASPDHSRITAAVGFMEALLNNDTMAIKPYLTDAAQKAITVKDWESIASQATTAAATFSAPVWSGDTTAVVTFSAATATGTITFALDPSKADAVTMDGASASGTEHDIIGLTKAADGWRVLTLDNGAGDVTSFDATFVKSMVP